MGDVSLVEEAFNRLKGVKNCEGLFVMNGDGVAIRSTMENDVTVHYAAVASRFVEKARSTVKALDAEDELQHCRIRSKKHEIVVAPAYDRSRDLYLVAVHRPCCD